MPIEATSVRLDADTLERISRMEKAIDRLRAWIIAHVTKAFIEQEEWEAFYQIERAASFLCSYNQILVNKGDSHAQ